MVTRIDVCRGVFHSVASIVLMHHIAHPTVSDSGFPLDNELKFEDC